MPPRTRLTAAERGEQLVQAAVTAFARGGYAGTTTDDVARLAGVSQPYVIRLFGSKQKLFLDVISHVSDRIQQVFRDAAAAQEAEGGKPDKERLGAAYDELLGERDLLVVLLHGYAAGSDPEIGAVVRDCFGQIYELVRELTGASAEEASDFMARGMLLTVLASIHVLGPDAVPREPWMTEIIDCFHDHEQDEHGDHGEDKA